MGALKFLGQNNGAWRTDYDLADEVAAFIPPAPCKVYAALLTQSNQDAPVATVLQNTLGGELVWSYNSTGVYVGTLAGTFLREKVPTLSGFTDPMHQIGVWVINRGNDDTINLTVLDGGLGTANPGSDDNLNATFIEIRVYP